MLPYVVIGACVCIRIAFHSRRITALAALLFAWLFYLTFFHTLNNLPIEQPLFLGVLERFWIQPLAMSTVFLAVGIHYAAHVLRPAIVCPVLATVVALGLSTQYSLQDQSLNTHTSDFGKAILSTLPKNAVLVTKGDILTNSARYVQALEGFRPDVSLVDLEMMRGSWYIPRVRKFLPNVTFPGKMYAPEPGCFDARAFIERNTGKMKDGRKDRRRLFVAYDFITGDSKWKRDYINQPHGIADEILPKRSGVMQLDQLRSYLKETENFPKPNELRFTSIKDGDPKYADGSWEHVERGDYWAVHHRVGLHLLKPLVLERDDFDKSASDTNPHYVSLKAAIERFEYIMGNGTNTQGCTERIFGLTAKFYGQALNTLLHFNDPAPRPGYTQKDLMRRIVLAFDTYLAFVDRTKEGTNDSKQDLVNFKKVADGYREQLNR